jgi:hypothetical protein
MWTRFSLRFLLGLTAVVAVCFAILHAGTEWTRLIVNLVVLFLGVATLSAFFGRAQSRVFSTGFSVCGWAYLLLWQVAGFRDRLYPAVWISEFGRSVYRGGEADQWGTHWMSPLELHGNFLSVLLVGLIGGVIALLIDRRARRSL